MNVRVTGRHAGRVEAATIFRMLERQWLDKPKYQAMTLERKSLGRLGRDRTFDREPEAAEVSNCLADRKAAYQMAGCRHAKSGGRMIDLDAFPVYTAWVPYAGVRAIFGANQD